METSTTPASREALQRTRDDAILLGVCGGLGHSLGVAPLWPRLGAIALGALVPPVALIAYALLGVVVRRDDGRMALGGAPDDSRESTIGWVVVLIAGWAALATEGALRPGAPSSVLLLAVAAAAAVAAYSAGRSTPAPDGPAGLSTGTGTDTVAMPVPPPTPGSDDDTVALPAPPGAAEAPPQTGSAAAPAPRPGPSLLLIGVGVLAVLSLGTVVANPVSWLALDPGRTVETGAGTLGLLALIGVVAAIVFSGRRHAGGLLALSLVVGVMAVGLASVADDASRLDGSDPVVEWTFRRAADVLRLDP